MKKCEYCDKEHYGSYGSGRFCSEYCARGFSTKNKRKDINEKVREKLSIEPYKKICKECGKPFSTKIKNRKVCGVPCAARIAARAKKPGSGGLRHGGGYSKLVEYNSPIAGLVKLNAEEIRLAKILDELELIWERNNKGFKYTTKNGKERRFYPDFYIYNFDYYLEYKGWIIEEHVYKMQNAVSKNGFDLLIVYGDDKRYKKLGLNISTIEENPNLLVGNMV